jgi:GT2 family glycosyltransferase
VSLSVIIPSRTESNLIPCVAAVREHEPEARIVVAWDSVSSIPGKANCYAPFQLEGRADVDIRYSREPFIFAASCNIGIRASGQSDIVLLNDDALLQTPGGFTAMQRETQLHPEFGVIAATCNNVGNTNQHPQGIGLRVEPRMVCFVAALIPRRTIETVGLLDENFTAYGWEDNDYCRRVRESGLKIGIFDGCYVDHGSLTSTFRGAAGAGGNIQPGAEIYRRKWGSLD